MWKIFTLGVPGVFMLSFALAVTISTVSARPPVPCTYRCINGLGYRCCLVDGVEICEYQPWMACIRW